MKPPLVACRLCGARAKLCSSHIIPEFLFTPLYDDKHRFNEATIAPNPHHALGQKGMREPLLCVACETRFSVLENYASYFLKEILTSKLTSAKESLLIEKLQYTELKLFSLSLLWRSGVSQNPMFGQVKLGKFEERLRRMLVDSDPGDASDFGCLLTCCVTGQNRLLDSAITTPERTRIDSHVSYRFFIGGCKWEFVVSNHSSRFRARNLFIQVDGSWLVQFVSAEGDKWLQTRANEIKDIRRIILGEE